MTARAKNGPIGHPIDLLPFACFTTRCGVIDDANEDARALGFVSGRIMTELSLDLAHLIANAEKSGRPGKIPEFDWNTGDQTRHVSIHVTPVPSHAFSVPAAGAEMATGVSAGALVVIDDITTLLETSDELARTVIESEVTNRQLDRSNSILSLLARFGGDLMRAESAPHALSLLDRSLAATRLFSEVEIVAADSTERGPLGAEQTARWPTAVEQRIRDALEGSRARDVDPTEGFLVHPVQGREILHALIVARFEPHATEEAGLFDIDAFASMTAFTLDNLLLHRDLVASLRGISFQNRVARVLQESTSQREIEARLDELLRAHFPITWFRILTSPSQRLGPSQPLGAANSDYPESMDELIRLGFRGHAVARRLGDGSEGSGICVPIRLAMQGSRPELRQHGVLAAVSSSPDTFEGQGRELFLATTDLAAISIRNARIHDDLRAHNVAVQYLNEELSGTVSDLKAASEMKSRFVSIVSHEFRSPLTSIISYAETLLADPDIERDTRQTFLGVIRDETERLTRLINQLLDLSRLQAHDRELARIPTDVRAAGEKVVAALRPVALKKKISLSFAPATAPCVVTGDPDAIQQVIWNLAGNAVCYTLPDGTIEIAVEGDARFVYIRVRDSGIGIPEDALEEIFGEFYTVPQTRARQARETDKAYLDSTLGGSGTGLGLSIARAIVTRHGGRIEVRSDVGAGTEFTVTLPRTVAVSTVGEEET